HEGRTAWKYEVTLGPALPAGETRVPAPVTSKNGPDETTKRRMTFFEKRDPKSLNGEVWVDSVTSVVLKARLDGRLEIADKDGPASMRAVLDATVTEIGQEQKIDAPKEFLPDQNKPLNIAAAPDKFGIARGGAD